MPGSNPTQAQEDANAAYVWMVKCREAVAQAAANMVAVKHPELVWQWNRYCMAVERERELSELV